MFLMLGYSFFLILGYDVLDCTVLYLFVEFECISCLISIEYVFNCMVFCLRFYCIICLMFVYVVFGFSVFVVDVGVLSFGFEGMTFGC